MTTTERDAGAERALASRPVSGGGLQVRLWIGQNPLLFVAVCVLIGYWLGRGARGGSRQ